MDKMKIDDFIKKLDNLKNELKEEEESLFYNPYGEDKERW